MANAGAAKKKSKLRLVRSPGSLKLKLVPISSPPPPSDHQFTPADSTPTGRPRIVFKFRIPPPPQEKEKEKEKEKQLSSPQPAAMMMKKKRSAADLGEEKHGKRQRRLDSGFCCDSTEEIAVILSRFESKGFKLAGVKLVVPSKEFAVKHYHDLKERPFCSSLCDFLSYTPVLAMVWKGLEG